METRSPLDNDSLLGLTIVFPDLFTTSHSRSAWGTLMFEGLSMMVAQDSPLFGNVDDSDALWENLSHFEFNGVFAVPG